MIQSIILYCKKCGRQIPVIFDWDDINKNRVCDVCKSHLYEVPHEYIDKFRWRDGDGKQAVIEELVKTSPEFDSYLFEHRDEILAKRSFKGNLSMPKCPTCGSTKVEKISLGEKVLGGAVFGLFSSDVRHTMHCKNCGYKW